MIKLCHPCNTQQQVHSQCFQQYGEYQGKKNNWNFRNNCNQAFGPSNSNWNSNKSSQSARNENKNSNWSFGVLGNKDSNWERKVIRIVTLVMLIKTPLGEAITTGTQQIP